MSIAETLKKQIEENQVILYMKGVPDAPECGFSANVVQVLKAAGVPFASVNVLANPRIREGLPKYSNWPTFPQLFIGGELVGGCDIVLELYQSGELKPMLEAATASEG